MVIMKSNDTFRSGFTFEIAFWHGEFSAAGADQAYRELCREQIAILVKRQKAFEKLVKAYRKTGSDLEIKHSDSDRWCALWGTSEAGQVVRCQVFDQDVFIGCKQASSLSDMLYWCVMQGFTEPTCDSVNLWVEPECRKGIQVGERLLAA